MAETGRIYKRGVITFVGAIIVPPSCARVLREGVPGCHAADAIKVGEPAFDVLQEQIVERFGGTETTVGAVEHFVLAETAFRETHYKQQVLRVLELSSPPRLEAISPQRNRRRGTYGQPSMKLKFR